MLADPAEFLDEDQTKKMKNPDSTVARDLVYSNVSFLCLQDQLRLIRLIIKDLHQPGWTSSFGGDKWAEGASIARLLGFAMIRFCKKPDEAAWQKCAMYYNRVINSCHNSGKILTKWCDKTAFSLGSTAPALCLMNPVAARLSLGLDGKNISRSQLRNDFLRATTKVRVKK